MKVLTPLEWYQSLMRPQYHISILFCWLQHQPMLPVSQQHPQIRSLPPPHQTPFVSLQHPLMQIPSPYPILLVIQHQPNLQTPDPARSLAGEQPKKHSFSILEIPPDWCSPSSQRTQCIGAGPAAGQPNQPMQTSLCKHPALLPDLPLDLCQSADKT
uniref:Amelogenin n=1 Tax=Apteryx owenii TaxID=8824 RepID=A0A8B9QAC4_APTOW